jgi:NitT/TauT family transport system substrate-binding protein
VDAVVALNNQLDPAQQKAQLALQESYVYTDFSKTNGTCAFDPQVIRDTVTTLKEFGDLKSDVDVEKLYTTEFIKAK